MSFPGSAASVLAAMSVVASPAPVVDCSCLPDLCEQHHKDSLSVEKVLQQYAANGVLPPKHPAIFGEADYSETFHDAFDNMRHMEERFKLLPQRIRERFKTPQAVLSAVARGELVQAPDGGLTLKGDFISLKKRASDQPRDRRAVDKVTERRSNDREDRGVQVPGGTEGGHDRGSAVRHDVVGGRRSNGESA